MKVVILCGGMGYRLREETEFKPKPLVEIGGKPILWHIMKIYAHYGHKEFILPLGYKGDMIKEFFVESKWRTNDFTLSFLENKVVLHNGNAENDWIIHFVETGLESGTAVRINKIKHLLQNDEEFLLTYGDGVSDVDINKIIEFHRRKQGVATLIGVQSPSRFGILKEIDGKVESFSEKIKIEEYINGGFMVFNKKIFDYLPDNLEIGTMIERATLPKVAEEGKLFVFKHSGFWHCMDSYRDYMDLNAICQKGNAPWEVWSKKQEIKYNNSLIKYN